MVVEPNGTKRRKAKLGHKIFIYVYILGNMVWAECNVCMHVSSMGYGPMGIIYMYKGQHM